MTCDSGTNYRVTPPANGMERLGLKNYHGVMDIASNSDTKVSRSELRKCVDRRWAYTMCKLEEAVARGIKDTNLGPEDLVVDFGCADRPYRHLLPGDVRYCGVDIPGVREADLHIGADGLVPLPDACASLVLSTQVLEHVDDPVAYLKEAHRLLRKGGTLLISTHGCFHYHPDPNDYWRWTRQGLEKIILERSFDLQSVTGVVGAAAAAIQYFSDHTGHKIPLALTALYYRLTQWLVGIFDAAYTPAGRLSDPIVFVMRVKKS